jgi:DeoR/GlpR family transcriptional regulator of sugar metabolism
MTLNERHNAILEILKQNRTANVKKLAERLFVSDATIRRDLKEMQALGLIERSHGGAILPDNAEEVSIFVRMNKNAKAKEQVATNALP